MSEKDMIILPIEMKKTDFGSGIKDHDMPIIHQTRMPYTVAKIATGLVERWGLVAAAPDGVDDSGRQKMRRQTPGELTAEACETAALLWKEFETRGWLVEIPLPVKRVKKEKEEEDA